MNLINNNPFLRTTRKFPTENAKELSSHVDKSYLDIAGAVNDRTIGLFPTTKAAITGEAWFLSANEKQQSFRQVYTFTGPTTPITILHGLNLTQIGSFVRIWGTFTDATNWYPLPYVDVVNANNQVNVIVNTNSILITAGAGVPPAITSGIVIIEWLSLAPNTNTK